MAHVLVICQNFQGEPLEAKQIVFKAENSKEIYKKITDKNGEVQIDLKGPEQYSISIEQIWESKNYTQLILPMLKEGQSYGKYEYIIKIDPPREFTLENVYFETGRAELKKESFSELNELYELLNLKKTMVIEIGGHTDNTGSDESNQILSKNRANSVKKYLVRKGIEEHRISTQGYGERKPISSNDDEKGRQLNRRTEVRILNE